MVAILAQALELSFKFKVMAVANADVLLQRQHELELLVELLSGAKAFEQVKKDASRLEIPGLVDSNERALQQGCIS